MNYFYFLISGFVVCIAIVKRELLVQEQGFRVSLLISVILFFTGLIDIALYLTKGTRYFVSGALLCPLITLLQYRFSHKIFVKYVKREPKDTFFIYSENGLGKDRLFNLLYFIPAFWLLILITGGVEKLTKGN